MFLFGHDFINSPFLFLFVVFAVLLLVDVHLGLFSALVSFLVLSLLSG